MENSLTLLTFSLDRMGYALPAHEVQEVVPLPELTPLADAPPFVCGIFNLRGQIVTALDLRQRLGLARRAWDLKNAVVITPYDQKLYGLIVDEALTLLDVSKPDLRPAPDLSCFMGSLQGGFVLAVAKMEDGLVPVLNLNRVFMVAEPQELAELQMQENPGEEPYGRRRN